MHPLGIRVNLKAISEVQQKPKISYPLFIILPVASNTTQIMNIQHETTATTHNVTNIYELCKFEPFKPCSPDQFPSP